MVDRSVMLGAGTALAEAERPWELRVEGEVADRGGSLGAALSEREYDFVAESGKSVNDEAKKIIHTLSSRCEISLSCH